MKHLKEGNNPLCLLMVLSSREWLVRARSSCKAVTVVCCKAVSEGARKGGLGLDVSAGRVLFKRLTEHAKSIEQAENLKLEDFSCRYLTVDDIWIPLGESLLIEMFSPLWNMAMDGFGNHDPGSGRYNQQIAPWDVIHPGRSWAKKLKPGKTEVEVLVSIEEHLKRIK